MDGFVTADAENGGAEDLMGCGVDQHPHEPPRLAPLDCAADLRHRPLARQRRTRRR